MMISQNSGQGPRGAGFIPKTTREFRSVHGLSGPLNKRSRLATISSRRAPRCEKRVHARLFPHPFFGSLTDAAVYILTGNPGFDCNDYFDELGNPDYERACVRNLRGKADGFLPLSKEAEGTGAHRYWTRSLQPVIKTLAARLSAPSSVARQHICSKLAVLESLAYHSKERPGSYSDELPSSLCIRAFVETQLLPRARAGEIGIFVWRRRGFWGIDGEQPGVYLRSTGFINRNLFPEEVDFLASQIARVVES